jgi:hypothetical protein
MPAVLKYFCLISFLVVFAVTVRSQNSISPADKRTVSEFEKQAKKYADLRDSLSRRLPRLSDDATPVQISAYKTAFQKSVQSARNNAKRGELFTPAASRQIRVLIKTEFQGWERSELRKTVLEADTKGVPLKINLPYPETKELVEMSPALLLTLPQLPKPLRYRFAGRRLLLLDRDNGLIIDYMTNALP